MFCYFSKEKYVTKKDPSLCLKQNKTQFKKKAFAKSVRAGKCQTQEIRYNPPMCSESALHIAVLCEGTEACLQTK